MTTYLKEKETMKGEESRGETQHNDKQYSWKSLDKNTPLMILLAQKLAELQKAEECMWEIMSQIFLNFSLSTFLQTGWRKNTRLKCLWPESLWLSQASLLKDGWKPGSGLLNDLSSMSGCDSLSGGC